MNQKAYLVGTHRYSFRGGEPAEIIGVQFLKLTNVEARPCYHVQFADGMQDLISLAESHHFVIISEDDVRSGRIPAVVH
ncbi:MAG: hypothetical protein KBC02_03030 [Candidatus Pacebacteria bacterium]|nr:hypothetical protein [Candidatus Paceibacterota bacterium]